MNKYVVFFKQGNTPVQILADNMELKDGAVIFKRFDNALGPVGIINLLEVTGVFLEADVPTAFQPSQAPAVAAV